MPDPDAEAGCVVLRTQLNSPKSHSGLWEGGLWSLMTNQAPSAQGENGKLCCPGRTGSSELGLKPASAEGPGKPQGTDVRGNCWPSLRS